MTELETGIFDLVKAIKKIPAGVTQYAALLTDKGWNFSFKEIK